MPRLQLQLLALLLIAATSSSVAAASDPHASSSTVHMLSQSGRIESFDRMRNASSLYHTLFDSTTTETATLQRKQRIQERRARARAWLQSRPISAPQHVEPMSERQLQQLQTHSSQQQQRNLSWFNGGTSLTHSAYYLADPTEDYDKWAQAYRMLGGYIDCDHDKDGGGGSHDNNNNRNNGNEQSCSRWMLWAAVRKRTNEREDCYCYIQVPTYSSCTYSHILYTLFSSFFSMSTQTTREMSTTSTMEIIPQASWIATIRTRTGFS
jgi:TolA-binding protein